MPAGVCSPVDALNQKVCYSITLLDLLKYLKCSPSSTKVSTFFPPLDSVLRPDSHFSCDQLELLFKNHQVVCQSWPTSEVMNRFFHLGSKHKDVSSPSSPSFNKESVGSRSFPLSSLFPIFVILTSHSPLSFSSFPGLASI